MLDIVAITNSVRRMKPQTAASIEFVRAMDDRAITYLCSGSDSARSACLTFRSRLRSVTARKLAVRGIADVTEALSKLSSEAMVSMHHFAGKYLKCTIFVVEPCEDVVGCICIDRVEFSS